MTKKATKAEKAEKAPKLVRVEVPVSEIGKFFTAIRAINAIDLLLAPSLRVSEWYAKVLPAATKWEERWNDLIRKHAGEDAERIGPAHPGFAAWQADAKILRAEPPFVFHLEPVELAAFESELFPLALKGLHLHELKSRGLLIDSRLEEEAKDEAESVN